MTAYATRSPLQLLHNPYVMSDTRKAGRRTSDRLREKEDTQLPNGVAHGTERLKSSQNAGTGAKQSKANGSDSGAVKGRGKRKIDYEEESDGLMFTRTRSKKAKAAAAVKDSEAIPATIQEEEPKPVSTRKTRKKSSEAPNAVVIDQESKSEKPERRRRSARNSGEQIVSEPPPVQVKKRRAKQRDPSTPAPESQPALDERPPQQEAPQEGSGIQNEEATKIALPFADTPIIRRNKEMRANSGQRRSSLGNRGRRASSLIDSGKSNAMPHAEVETCEFYRHIESSLPEPRRMRQLLTWCGTRALEDKPSFDAEDSQARLAAREIQQQLLKDFSVKSELSDWFGRRESTPPPKKPKPHPKNLSNLDQIADLEQKIARLQTERQTWEALLQPPSKPLLEPVTQPQVPQSIARDLLSSPTQIAALDTIQSFHAPSHPSTETGSSSSSTLHASASSRIQGITSNLEFSIDVFADNVHALSSYQSAAGNLADTILGMSAEALEERERLGREKERENAGLQEREGEIGTRDVLRGLSRVIDR